MCCCWRVVPADMRARNIGRTSHLPWDPATHRGIREFLLSHPTLGKLQVPKSYRVESDVAKEEEEEKENADTGQRSGKGMKNDTDCKARVHTRHTTSNTKVHIHIYMYICMYIKSVNNLNQLLQPVIACDLFARASKPAAATSSTTTCTPTPLPPPPPQPPR